MPHDDLVRLLVQAQEAHHEFEEAVLKGVYDEEWPAWYAAYAVENGVNALLPQPVTADQLRLFLVECNEQYERSDKQQSWHEFAAQFLLQKLT